LEIGCGKAMINPHIVAVGPAQLLQPLLERLEACVVFRILTKGFSFHHPQSVTLLKPFNGERQLLRVQHGEQLGYCFVGITRPRLKIFAENLASLTQR
jgi:hypothetical protein